MRLTALSQPMLAAAVVFADGIMTLMTGNALNCADDAGGGGG